MPDLRQLFNLHGTDKDRIGYSAVYRALLEHRRDEALTLLEIGIGTLVEGAHSSMVGYALPGYRPGGSLRAWRDYFPRARIFGVDVQADTQLAEERITTYLCDSTDPDAVDSVFGQPGIQFDVVVDDGSHVDRNQLATLRNFFPRVRPGGWYVIEDIHPEASMIADPDEIPRLCDGAPHFFAGLSTILCVISKTRSGSRAAG